MTTTQFWHVITGNSYWHRIGTLVHIIIWTVEIRSHKRHDSPNQIVFLVKPSLNLIMKIACLQRSVSWIPTFLRIAFSISGQVQDYVTKVVTKLLLVAAKWSNNRLIGRAIFNNSRFQLLDIKLWNSRMETVYFDRTKMIVSAYEMTMAEIVLHPWRRWHYCYQKYVENIGTKNLERLLDNLTSFFCLVILWLRIPVRRFRRHGSSFSFSWLDVHFYLGFSRLSEALVRFSFVFISGIVGGSDLIAACRFYDLRSRLVDVVSLPPRPTGLPRFNSVQALRSS